FVILPAAFRRYINNAAKSVSTKNSRGSGQDFNPLDTLQRDEVQIDRVEVRFIDSDAINEDTGRRNRLRVEASQIHSRLKLIAQLIIKNHTGLILKNLLDGFRAELFNLLPSDNDHFARYLGRLLLDIFESSRRYKDRRKSSVSLGLCSDGEARKKN